MTTQHLSVHHVSVDHVMRFLNSGYGRLKFQWNDHIWRCWQYLHWDLRPDSVRDTQPEDVDAYVLSPEEAQLLGVVPKDETEYVLFILYEVQAESVPLRAAVIGERPMEADFTPVTSP